MKNLFEYIIEAIKPGSEYFQFELEDLEQWDLWHPNDDITRKECIDIVNAFNKKYPTGEINDYMVECEYRKSTILFTVFVNANGTNIYRQDPINKEVITVIEDIINLLTNTVYSVGPGRNAKQLIKNMLNKI